MLKTGDVLLFDFGVFAKVLVFLGDCHWLRYHMLGGTSGQQDGACQAEDVFDMYSGGTSPFMDPSQMSVVLGAMLDRTRLTEFGLMHT